MPKVLNKKTDKIPPDAVYVGRPTKWGNPFSHLNGTLAKYKVGSRNEAVESYKIYINSDENLLKCLNELKGKDLVCWCSPEACHADILMELANS